MKVGLLTEQQKDQLVGVLYTDDTYYYPIQDDEGNWVISTTEMEFSDLEWMKTLPLIDFIDPINNLSS